MEHQAIAETLVPVNKTQGLVIECGNSLFQKDAEALRQRLLRELKPDVSEVRFDLMKKARHRCGRPGISFCGHVTRQQEFIGQTEFFTCV